MKALDAIGFRLAVSIANRVKRRAITAMLKGEEFKVRDLFTTSYVKVLSRAMLHAHLHGTLQARKSNPSLQLDQLDNLIRTLSKQLDIQLIDDLQEKFETRALRVLNDVSSSLEEDLRQTINDLILEGATTGTGRRRLGEAFAKAGLTGEKPHRIEAIFRTQTQLALNAAKWQEEQTFDDILWGYKYVTVGDTRVRPDHADVDGVTLPKEDPFWQLWYPPNGWNCRCVAIPLFTPRPIIRPDDPTLDPDPDFRFNPGSLF